LNVGFQKSQVLIDGAGNFISIEYFVDQLSLERRDPIAVLWTRGRIFHLRLRPTRAGQPYRTQAA
jgi:hypothetical protein